MEIYNERSGLSLAGGKKTKGIISANTNGVPISPQKSSLSRRGIPVGGPKGLSQGSFKHGDLVQTAHFIDDETVAQRS